MAMYRCEHCDEFYDDDYFPMEDVKGKTVCPECLIPAEMQAEALEQSEKQRGVVLV